MVIYSNITMFVLVALMFAKSIFMIQRSIEEQRKSEITLRNIIKVNKWQLYFFASIAVVELAALIFGL